MNRAAEAHNLQEQADRLTRENQALREALQKATVTKSFNWRSFWMWLLLAISVVVLVVAGMLVWLNRTLFNADSYIQTVGPIIRESAVQKAITTHASSALFADADVEQKVADALPPQAQFLASPIASQVETQTTNVISKVVASSQFYSLWIKVNERAQGAFVQAAHSGRSSPVININDVYGYLSSQLQDTKLAPLLNRQLPASVGSIQVLNAPLLVKIPHWASLLNAWRWILVAVAVALAALAVAVAPNRRRGVIGVGLAWMAAAILSLVIIRIVRAVLLGQVTNDVDETAAVAVWQTLLHFFYIQLAITFLLGLAAAIVGWFLGPGAVAVRVRSGSQRSLTAVRGRFVASPSDVPVIAFLQRHRQLFEWGLLGLTVLFLLLFIPLTIATALIILVLALIALVILETLAAPTPSSRKHT